MTVRMNYRLTTNFSELEPNSRCFLWCYLRMHDQVSSYLIFFKLRKSPYKYFLFQVDKDGNLLEGLFQNMNGVQKTEMNKCWDTAKPIKEKCERVFSMIMCSTRSPILNSRANAPEDY